MCRTSTPNRGRCGRRGEARKGLFFDGRAAAPPPPPAAGSAPPWCLLLRWRLHLPAPGRPPLLTVGGHVRRPPPRLRLRLRSGHKAVCAAVRPPLGPGPLPRLVAARPGPGPRGFACCAAPALPAWLALRLVGAAPRPSLGGSSVPRRLAAPPAAAVGGSVPPRVGLLRLPLRPSAGCVPRPCGSPGSALRPGGPSRRAARRVPLSSPGGLRAAAALRLPSVLRRRRLAAWRPPWLASGGGSLRGAPPRPPGGGGRDASSMAEGRAFFASSMADGSLAALPAHDNMVWYATGRMVSSSVESSPAGAGGKRCKSGGWCPPLAPPEGGKGCIFYGGRVTCCAAGP